MNIDDQGSMNQSNERGHSRRTDVDRTAGSRFSERPPGDLSTALDRIDDGFFAFDPAWRCVFANNAGAQLIGRDAEDLVGHTPQQVFPEAIGQPLFDALQRAESTGGAVHMRLPHDTAGASFDVSIYPSVDGTTVMLRGSITHRQAGVPLQDSEARQALLLSLVQGQRETGDPDAMMAAASEALGRHLGANRVGFFEMVDDDTLGFTICWSDGVLEPLAGTMPASWIGTRYLAEVRAGRTLGFADYTCEPLTADARFDQIGTRALIGAPIIRGGRWHAGLYVNHASVREWTPDEIALVKDIADQTWDAIERARAEQALRASEARFRAVWEATSDAIALSDPDGTVLAANPAYLELYGFDESEVVGQSFAIIFPEEQRQWAEEQHRSVFALPELPPAYEARIRRKDGTERAVEARADFVVERGRRTAMVSAIRDTTHRLAAEEALRESEERLRLALEATEMGVYQWDPMTDRSDLNARLLEMLGLEIDEEFSLAGALSRNIHPDDRARYATAARAMLDPAGSGRLAEEVRWLGSDGRERWLAFAGRAYFEGEGADRRPVRAIGGVLDITARKRSEQALRASEERFRTLIQRSADAVQLIDPDGTIVYSSDSVETVTGYRPGELSGENILRSVHPDDVAMLTSCIAEIGSIPGGVGAMEYRTRHKDGSWAWVETTFSNHLETASIAAIVGNFRNVTDRKRNETERQAFAASAAHDLKTPLTSLIGGTQLLLRRVRRGQGDTATVEAGLESTVTAARRMVALIDEVMDAALLEAGQALDLRTAPTDLVALAEATATEGRSTTTRHSVRVVAEVPALVGTWDGGRLERVLGNLLGNAIKFSPDGGEVVLRLRREEDTEGAWAVLTVSDQGVGIPPDDLQHIFKRYRRGGNVANQIGGTGIGLAGAARIVAQHGGTMDVDSTEGQGSTFTLRLPLDR